jgi:hypothetical protein
LEFPIIKSKDSCPPTEDFAKRYIIADAALRLLSQTYFRDSPFFGITPAFKWLALFENRVFASATHQQFLWQQMWSEARFIRRPWHQPMGSDLD